MSDQRKADPQNVDPFALARRDLKKGLPRRFWQDVTIVPRDGGYGIDLDGKAARTPGQHLLVAPRQSLAETMRAEWAAQGEFVEPATMPLTRLVNTALDGVAYAVPETIAEIAKFAETDLVCYRADSPQSLVSAQTEAWDPILRFAADRFDARFICATGVLYVEQPAEARAAVKRAVEAIAAGPDGVLRLTALSLLTNLMGSVLLALAVADGLRTAEAAWAAAQVDETFQADMWGRDTEAEALRATRWRDLYAAAQVFEAA
jgi:chaperone required for assembly of F1-ATPase